MDRVEPSHARIFFVFAAVAVAVFALPQAALSQPGASPVFREAEFFLDLYGYFADTIRVYGPCEIEWSDTWFDGGSWVIDTELLDPRMHGETPGFGCVSVYQNGLFPSEGKIEFPPPDPDFPAESFFDVFFDLYLPDIPGLDTLHTEIPLNINSLIEQNPPYFESYEAVQPVSIPVHDRFGAVVGEITSWKESMIPWSPPAVWLETETSYGTDLAVARNDTVVFTAGVAGYIEHDPMDPAPCLPLVPFSATFGLREEGSPEPFMPFYTDFDGTGGEIGTVTEMLDGDGWAGYLDISSFDPEGGRYEIEVVVDLGESAPAETLRVTIDPTPPIPPLPEFDPDSTVNTMPETLLQFVTAPPAEILSQIQLRAVRLSPDFERPLEIVHQDSLSRDRSTAAVCCGPASAACCLKYWAKNGHPGLEHPDGDVNKPEQTGIDMGKELVGDINPRAARNGAQIGAIESGIKKYLKRHGETGWSISHHDTKSMSDYARMMREFEVGKEDVIMIVSDTTTIGGKKVRTGHAVTLGSRHNSTENGVVKREVDFMDPADGTVGSDNRFEVGQDSEGYPTTKEYTHTDAFSDARISGYIKVSPPAAGGAGNSHSAMRSPYGAQEEEQGWVLIDSVPGRGGGLSDTLWWDTTGFEPGLYLVEVSAEDASGTSGSTLRSVYINGTSTSAGEGGQAPPAARLVSAWPNPFNPSTTIEYEVPRRSRVTLRIYDVAGRLVRSLVEGEYIDAGLHRTSWDGKDSGGSQVASGIYFCALESTDGGSSSKLVLIR